MKAQIGDRLQFYRRLDQSTRVATVSEVGAGGDPPSRLRFADGTEKLVFPGSDGVAITGDTGGGGR